MRPHGLLHLHNSRVCKDQRRVPKDAMLLGHKLVHTGFATNVAIIQVFEVKAALQREGQFWIHMLDLRY